MTQRIEYDVVVIGYGSAGAAAAVEAARSGAGRVLLVEKLEHLGGNSALAGGYLRVADDKDKAARYLARTCGNHVPKHVVNVLAAGMTEIVDYLYALAKPLDATVKVSIGPDQSADQTIDLYDWEGRETFGWAGIEAIPEYPGYPWLHSAKLGQYLMYALECAVNRSGIDVWFNTSATELLRDASRVCGVRLQRGEELLDVYASGGVILACGGFEFNETMIQSYLEMPVVYPTGSPGNTGDGIRMSTELGAGLWHMWHIHGSYGFKFSPFPVAFRNHLGGVRRNGRPVAWILVDQDAKRFMNEVPPAPQDTGSRPFNNLDSEKGRFDRIPAWMIFDEDGRKLGPIAKTVSSVPEHFYQWSPDNTAEIDRGWIVKANTIPELAEKTRLPTLALQQTLARWEQICTNGTDEDFQRPSGTFSPINQPPYYAVQVYPVVTNTQGGLQHDEHYRVVTLSGKPINGLYAIGELSSIFGHIYMLGGNLTECLVGGQIAGRHAAASAAEHYQSYSLWY